jgi:hypothetical protein
MKEWIVTIYHDFGPVEIRCESINNALHVIKARREIFPDSIYKLAHKEYRK